jgi:hypothetical protein
MNIGIALNSLRPGAQWSINGIDYEGLIWHDEIQSKPSKEEVEAEIARLQAEYDAKEYQRLRAPEYPSIGDQLDALFHAGVFPPEMAAQIQAIKDKYPKPE